MKHRDYSSIYYISCLNPGTFMDICGSFIDHKANKVDPLGMYW